MRRALPAISFLGAACLIAVSVTAWSSSDDKPVDDTARSISDQDLSEMVLRLEQFPLEYQGFHASDKNGARTLEERVDEAFDHDKTRARLQQFGFVSGYHTTYSNPEFPGQMPAVVAFATDVDLFTTADAAAGDFKQSVADIPGEKGISRNDATLDNAEVFDHEIADQSAGARFQFTVKRNDGSTLDVRVLQIAFRHGRLEGSVTATFTGLSDLDKANMEGRVKDLARQLNDQITHVLSSAVAPSATG